MRCTMLVDVSKSMQYGNGPMNKYEIGATIAASLAYLLLKQQDSVGCISFDEGVRVKVPTLSKRTHLQSIIRSLDIHRPKDKTDMYAMLREVAGSFSSAWHDGFNIRSAWGRKATHERLTFVTTARPRCPSFTCDG